MDDEPNYDALKGARKEGVIIGAFWGLLIGAVGIPTACSLLPDHLNERLKQTAQPDD
jgi:hypothetical protein